MASFMKFGLNEKLLQVLAAKGLTDPTPVQQQAIPAVMQGLDVLACAPTGTGKTAAFALPVLHKILAGPSNATKGRGPRVLVLSPTRELAQQIADASKMFASGARVTSGVIVGGVSYGPQRNLLKNQLDMLVATPGRLIDHLQDGLVDFSRVEMVVLDEADKMLDMGFLKPVQRIFAGISAARRERPQVLLFSATFTPAVQTFAKAMLHNPVKIEVALAPAAASQIVQKAYRVDNAPHKFSLLKALLADAPEEQAIVFSATKHQADKLAQKLVEQGIASAALHGGMKQGARKRTLAEVHTGRVRVLVATDVAARGIDVKSLGKVINFDLPQVAEDYVHRIGRTGRAGASGMAISLVAPSDVPMLRDIEKILGKPMSLGIWNGLEPNLSTVEFAAQGAVAPRSRQGRRPSGGHGGGAQRGGSQRFSPRGSSGGARPSGRR